MTHSALVLAAHGCHAEPLVNRRIHAYADRLASRSSFDEVLVAFHQGSPSFSQVLDLTTASDIVVVPVMTSNGYYCSEVLPRELAGNRRYAAVRIRQTAPLGVHPRVSLLLARRIQELFVRFEISPGDSTVIVVGHGTERHSSSREATIQLAATLAGFHGAVEVLPAFLDHKPRVGDIVARASCNTLLAIPFLIADGRHAARDVPKRLGLDVAAIDKLPHRATVAGRTVICDTAVGSYQGIVDVLAIMAEEARCELERESSTSLAPAPATPA